MTRVDRDKTKRINNLILEGINEVKKNKENEATLKKHMELYGILGGETRKTILTQNVDELKLSVKYMLLDSFFKMTNDDQFNLDFFYNTNLKLKFLHRYPNNTQIPYSRIFEKSKIYEEEYKKDLSEFTIPQIENVLFGLEPLTESASHVNGRIITAYIDWCIENKQANVTKNELKEESVSFFAKFVDKDLELYFTKDTVDKITWYCNNPQDAIIINLLFHGIEGKSLAEIRNIKKEHVIEAMNNNNLITVYDEDGSKRKVRLEDSTLHLLERAMNQDLYEKRNGDVKDKKLGVYTNLVENDYVIRTSITKTEGENRPVDKMVVYRRIKMISEVLEYPQLTAKNIVRSGIIYEGMKRMNNNTLTKDDYITISAIYNIDNWYPIQKFCNPQMINKLYNNTDNKKYATV